MSTPNRSSQPGFQYAAAPSMVSSALELSEKRPACIFGTNTCGRATPAVKARHGHYWRVNRRSLAALKGDGAVTFSAKQQSGRSAAGLSPRSTPEAWKHLSSVHPPGYKLRPC
eukprot:1172220-Prorocentrum_minimum.AAC.1